MKGKWLEYQCSLVGVGEKDLLNSQKFLASLGVKSIVGFKDGSFGVQGQFTGDTKTEVKCKFKLLKEEIKKYFNIKKVKDMLVAEGDFVK